MKKSIASKVALAMIAGAATQPMLAAPQATAATATAQAAGGHNCAQKTGGKNCERVRCFGITRKGMNDCGTSKHACAAQAKTNNDPQEWIYVLKGNCKRIVGGSTSKPKADD